jgi:hypothetical protein
MVYSITPHIRPRFYHTSVYLAAPRKPKSKETKTKNKKTKDKKVQHKITNYFRA